ncbi:hypothetical protein DFJ74DRAFT_657787 [Hyaloraphidium curvatum]|nr:hypothetical protein DFJ74DRAFT_657787 [Hyaloraphidium curvatum]
MSRPSPSSTPPSRKETPSLLPFDAIGLSGSAGQWANVVAHLKKNRVPLTIDDLERAGFAKLAERHPTIINELKRSPSIKYDPAKGTYQWIFEYDLHRGKEDLKRLLELNRDKQGFVLGELIESYPGDLREDVEKLESEGWLFLLRASNDWKKARIYFNDPGLANPVDKEFRDLWDNLTLPEGEDDIERELKEAGLKALGKDKPQNVEVQSKKKRRTGNRKMKIVNTHLEDLGIDLTKDYIVPPKE